MAADHGVKIRGRRQNEQDQDGDQADTALDGRVDPEWMQRGRDDACEGKAADAHAAHEGAQQYAKRGRRRADDEFEELEPDDLVDERGRPAAGEEEEQSWVESSRCRGLPGAAGGAHRYPLDLNGDGNIGLSPGTNNPFKLAKTILGGVQGNFA